VPIQTGAANRDRRTANALTGKTFTHNLAEMVVHAVVVIKKLCPTHNMALGARPGSVLMGANSAIASIEAKAAHIASSLFAYIQVFMGKRLSTMVNCAICCKF